MGFSFSEISSEYVLVTALLGALIGCVVSRLAVGKGAGMPLAGCLGALAFALLYVRFGVSASFVIHCALACLLLGLSLVDLKSLTIPNGYIFAVLAVWAAYMVFLFVEKGEGAALPYLSDGLLGALVVGVGMLAVSIIFEKLAGHTALGGGDVKLFFAVSLFLGLAPAILNVLVSCVLGLLFALVPRVMRRSDQVNVFPFGPAISLATLLTLVWGDPLVVWYITL